MLERLARTMYRRRRRVLVVWIVAPDRHVHALGCHRRRVPHRVQTARHREPGCVRPAREVELPRPPGAGADRLQVRRRASTIPPSGARCRVCSTRSSRRSPNVDGREPVRRRGRAADRAERRRSRTRELNFADRSDEAFTADGKKIKSSATRSTCPASRSNTAATCSPRPLNGVSEAIGILAAMIILLLAFGSVLAMGLPIGTALFGIGTGVAIVMSVRNVVDMPDFTTAAVAMVGLGVGIDYALFIVTRYRENSRRGARPGTQRRARDRHRGPRGAVRGFHRRDLGARPVADEDVDHARRRHRHLGRRAHHDAGVDHAAAGAARFRRPQHRQVGVCRHRKRPEGEIRESGWYRWSRVIQRHPWPAAIIGFVVPARADDPAVVDAARIHRRRATARRATPRARPTTSSPRDSGPGSTVRLLLAAETPERPGRRRPF